MLRNITGGQVGTLLMIDLQGQKITGYGKDIVLLQSDFNNIVNG